MWLLFLEALVAFEVWDANTDRLGDFTCTVWFKSKPDSTCEKLIKHLLDSSLTGLILSQTCLSTCLPTRVPQLWLQLLSGVVPEHPPVDNCWLSPLLTLEEQPQVHHLVGTKVRPCRIRIHNWVMLNSLGTSGCHLATHWGSLCYYLCFMCPIGRYRTAVSKVANPVLFVGLKFTSQQMGLTNLLLG